METTRDGNSRIPLLVPEPSYGGGVNQHSGDSRNRSPQPTHELQPYDDKVRSTPLSSRNPLISRLSRRPRDGLCAPPRMYVTKNVQLRAEFPEEIH